MKFFDLVGNKVVIHPDALALPPFRKVWEQDKEDKVYATNLISYVVLKNRYDSPYTKHYSESTAEEILKNEYFNDPKYKLTSREKQVEDEFRELNNTLSLDLLEGMKMKLRTFAAYYKNSLDEELDGKTIESHMKSMKIVEDVLRSIEKTEEKVKAEELTAASSKSKYEISRYEMPHNQR